MTEFTFDFEVNRCRPTENLTIRYGRVTLLADTYREAFDTAFTMVYSLRGVDMVTALYLVL